MALCGPMAMSDWPTWCSAPHGLPSIQPGLGGISYTLAPAREGAFCPLPYLASFTADVDEPGAVGVEADYVRVWTIMARWPSWEAPWPLQASLASQGTFAYHGRRTLTIGDGGGHQEGVC